MRNDMRNEIAAWIEQLYREGWLVKTLDASGGPVVYDDRQSYTYRDYATPAELAFWHKENKSR